MHMLTLLVAIAYALTLLAGSRAFRAAQASGRGPRDGHAWLIILILLVVLYLVRAAGLEVQLRSGLRDLAHELGRYESRRAWQALTAVLLLFVAAAASAWAFLHWQRAATSPSLRLLRIAQAAIGGFGLLYALRLLSLHMIDAVLYFGPVHPNWLLEAGLLATIAAAALRYTAHCRKVPGATRGDRR